MNILLSFIMGTFFGAVLVFLVSFIKEKDSEKFLEQLLVKNENQKVKDLENVIARLKESFGSLSFEALSKNSVEFLKLANETLSKQTESGDKNLEEKKKLIEQTVGEIKKDLKNMQDMVIALEKDREVNYGKLSESLKYTATQTGKLQETTEGLAKALSSSSSRGRWGERIADDILKVIGLIEGINYVKQKQQLSSKTIPDFTFLLPKDLKLNMDVKFPLDNYLRYLNADNELDQDRIKKQFLKDVKDKLKEVIKRDYINTEENTLDYVLLFIPNEKVYGFIHESDDGLLDEALKNKIILCSPFTLYAVLAVIRQAVDNFNLDKRAAEILNKLGVFYQQWQKFVESFERMGKKIDEAKTEFEQLTSTRKNSLERSLKAIEELREEKELS